MSSVSFKSALEPCWGDPLIERHGFFVIVRKSRPADISERMSATGIRMPAYPQFNVVDVGVVERIWIWRRSNNQIELTAYGYRSSSVPSYQLEVLALARLKLRNFVDCSKDGPLTFPSECFSEPQTRQRFFFRRSSRVCAAPSASLPQAGHSLSAMILRRTYCSFASIPENA